MNTRPCLALVLAAAAIVAAVTAASLFGGTHDPAPRHGAARSAYAL